jgi:hypothetical protein
VCGVRVEDVADPLMRRIRHLDKLIDEPAKGKKTSSILWKQASTRLVPGRGRRHLRTWIVLHPGAVHAGPVARLGP